MIIIITTTIIASDATISPNFIVPPLMNILFDRHKPVLLLLLDIIQEEYNLLPLQYNTACGLVLFSTIIIWLSFANAFIFER